MSFSQTEMDHHCEYRFHEPVKLKTTQVFHDRFIILDGKQLIT